MEDHDLDQKLFYRSQERKFQLNRKNPIFSSEVILSVITGYSSFLDAHLINGSLLLFFIQLFIKMMSWVYSYIFINLHKLNFSLVILSDMSAEQLFEGDISLQILMISAFYCLLCFQESVHSRL